MPRVFSTAGILRLDEAGFHAGIALLADSLASSPPPDVVIGIARGGSRLARGLAERLSCLAVIVRASHNQTDRIRQLATGLVAVDATAAAHLHHGLRLLLCDDIYGTGATLEAVTAELDAAVRPREIRTATLCRNTGAAGHPGWWVWEVSDWVVFPWDQPPAAPQTGRLTPPQRARCQP